MALSSTFRSRNSGSMAEFRVESLTYAHSRARPVPIAALTGYGLPPAATIPAGCSINIGRPSRLEPRTFETGTCAATTRSPTLYRLSYGTGNLYLFRKIEHDRRGRRSLLSPCRTPAEPCLLPVHWACSSALNRIRLRHWWWRSGGGQRWNDR